MTAPPTTVPALKWPNPHAYDPTRLRDLMLCFPRFYYRHMLSLEPGEKEAPFNVHLEFGRTFHAAVALYQLRKLQRDKNPVLAALNLAWAEMKSWPQWHENEEVLELRGLSAKKNQYTMIRALCWYHEALGRADPCTTLKLKGKPAIEITAQLKPFRSLPHVIISFIGDRIVGYGGGNYMLEVKTTGTALTSSYFNRFSPDIQIDIQAAVSRMVWPQLDIQGVIIEAAELGQNYARFNRIICARSPAQCAEALRNAEREIAQFETARQLYGENKDGELPELSTFLNSASCQAGGGPCAMRKVCSVDPADRLRVINQQFHQRKISWDPLQQRTIE